jgi:hypothetical protein
MVQAHTHRSHPCHGAIWRVTRKQAIFSVCTLEFKAHVPNSHFRPCPFWADPVLSRFSIGLFRDKELAGKDEKKHNEADKLYPDFIGEASEKFDLQKPEDDNQDQCSDEEG